MEAEACPTLSHVLSSEECFENLAGLGSVAYIFLKDDLAQKLTRTDNVYSGLKFKTGKGLYKVECKDESNKIEGESQGRRKGYKLTVTLVLESVNRIISKLARSLNNLDIGIIIPDDDEYQIMYDPNRKIVFDSGGIKTDTGAAAGDDRNTTLTASLQPVRYPNLYLELSEDIETLLEGYKSDTDVEP